MKTKIDPRDRAIDAAQRLFRIQGYTATGLTQILLESGAPKGSFYFYFPRGKAQLAEEAIDRYVASRVAVLQKLSAETKGDAIKFVKNLFKTFANEMVSTNFEYGCLMQNLANELPALDAELTQRIAKGFADASAVISMHFRECGFPAARAVSAASALVASLEGARTIARLERSAAIFKALSEISCSGLSRSEG